MARGDGRVTIEDVAREARVSQATVSRVLNGHNTVDPALAAKVMEVARALSYEPSRLARGLALGRTHTVALVVPDLENPMFQGALRGLSRAAGADGYRVLVADSAENVEEEAILVQEARRRCDALVLCAPRMPEEQLVALLPALAPVVLLNRDVPVGPIPWSRWTTPPGSRSCWPTCTPSAIVAWPTSQAPRRRPRTRNASRDCAAAPGRSARWRSRRSRVGRCSTTVIPRCRASSMPTSPR